MLHHGPTYTQCQLVTANEAVVTEPFTADDIKGAVNELSPRSLPTMSSMINTLTNATVASAMASDEDDTEEPVPEELPGANQPDEIWQLPSKASYQPTISTLGETATSASPT